MKFFEKKLILIVFIIIFSLNNFVFAAIKSNIIAKVGNEIITSFELENKIKTLLFFSNREVNQENIDQVKGQALKSLVDTKLMRDELKKYDFNFKNTDVKKYLEDISYKMNISNQELIKLFEIKKIDFEKYVEEIKINLTWQQFIYQLYSAKVSIDEDQISNELNQVIQNRKIIEEYKLAEIEIDILDKKKTNNLVEEIKTNISNNGFEETAKKYSISNTALDGGDLGWVSSTSLSDIIIRELDNLNEGEVSNPIFSSDKILFLKLKEKKKISNIDNLNVEKLKKSLIRSSSNQIFEMHSKNHLSKKKNLTIIKIINE